MHWIDPNCLPETQGAVEGFITNRHGEIDGVLLAVANKHRCWSARRRTWRPRSKRESKSARRSAFAVSGLVKRTSLRPWRSPQAVARRSSTTAPADEDEREPPHRRRQAAAGWKPKASCGCRSTGQRASCAARCSKTAQSFASVAKEAASLPNCCAPARGSRSAALVCEPNTAGHRRRGDWARQARHEAVAAPKTQDKDKPKHKKHHDEPALPGVSCR